MKKIDKLANIETNLKPGPGTCVVEISYQGDDGDDTVRIDGLAGRCVAYLEEGFLVADEEKWYFHDADGNLLATMPKADTGDCIRISGLGDFYYFDHSKQSGTPPDSSFLCLDVKGEKIQKSSFIGMSPLELFAADDPILEGEDGEFDEEGSRWSELKEMNKKIMEASLKAEAMHDGGPGEKR